MPNLFRKYRYILCVALVLALYLMLSRSLNNGFSYSEKCSSLSLQEQIQNATKKLYKILGTRNAQEILKLGVNTTIIEPSVSSQFLWPIPLLTILIVSTPDAVSRRNTIRNTWKKLVNETAIVYFFIGLSGNNSLDEKVKTEAQLRNDVIIEDTIEDYQRLVIKSLRLLKWFVNNGSKSKYLIKVDEDVFINFPRLTSYIQNTIENKINSSSIIEAADFPFFIGGYGGIRKGSLLARPIRDPNSKWFVPESWYPDSFYPPYLSGPFYIISAPTVPVLLTTSFNVPLITMEDVYITGMLPKAARISPQHIDGISPAIFSPYLNDFTSKEKIIFWYEFLYSDSFAWHPIKNDDFFYELYKHLNN